MSLVKSLLLSIAILSSGSAFSGNVIRTSAPIQIAPVKWVEIEPLYSDWVATTSEYGCSSATPPTTSYIMGTSFTQTVGGCSKDFERSRQAQIQNPVTKEIRVTGPVTVENKTESGLLYTRIAVGTRDGKEIFYGAGSGILNTTKVAGIYARKGELDIGDLQAIDGARLLAYFMKNTKFCELRIAATGMEGWVTAGAVATNEMHDYIDKIKKAELYLANGTKFGTYTLGDPSVTSEGGVIKRVAVPCSAIDTFYNDTSYFKKIVLVK